MTNKKIDTDLLLSIFFPHIHGRQKYAKLNNMRLVHYTSAEAAVNVLRTQKFWMRDSSCMNDYMEITHGLDSLTNAWKDAASFRDALNSIFPNIFEGIEELFNDWIPHFERDTYISCFSEHLNAEDNLGRLSMWRSYGKSTAVAVVMNNQAFFNETEEFSGLYVSPVDYCDGDALSSRLEIIAKNISDNANYLKTLGRDHIIGTISQFLKFTMICTKHVGFKEEREWRVLYCPKLESTTNVTCDVEVIDGIPQKVYKIPLIDKSKKGLVGFEIPKLIERIIIGPSRDPETIQKAFVDLLGGIDIPNPESKVFISEIPLRC